MLRRISVAKYYKKLHPHLQNRYGPSDYYTAGQITKTVVECGFSKKYTPYALGLFLEMNDFEQYMKAHYPEVDPDNIRAYIAKRFFEGNMNYSYAESTKRLVGNSSHDSIDPFLGT